MSKRKQREELKRQVIAGLEALVDQLDAALEEARRLPPAAPETPVSPVPLPEGEETLR